MDKVYIAGPMRGYERYNFPAFFEAEEYLKEHGYEPLNPARRDVEAGFDPGKTLEEQGGLTLKDFMRRDLPQLLECDAIFLLPGWQDSVGARLELRVARDCELQVLFHPLAVRDPVVDRIKAGITLRDALNG